MRVVVLCSSPYSETGCAMAARLAQLGHVPVGAITLPAWDRSTLLRKVRQWGLHESLRYARTKLRPSGAAPRELVRNPYLQDALAFEGGVLRQLHAVGRAYGFPVMVCRDQNAAHVVAQIRRWSGDLAIFTGGNLLRQDLLAAPRLGVLNSHLAMLPEIRGMSSPEWSLLCQVPLGVTIHRMDRGIDTGPILLRREFSAMDKCCSLTDLRNRMIAFGIELMAEVVEGLATGSLSPAPQTASEGDRQFYVMHDWLKAQAGKRLQAMHPSCAGRSREQA